MNVINKTALRQLHYKIAPLMLFPLLLTVITGTLFQVAVVTGNADDFLWLLELHRGKFGRINLEMVYPFLNGFGLLMLGVTGVIMWLQTRPRN
ncbi:PepSY domain-containing protein [Crocosphaera sp.]|uniref:PepSY domain-containing protein n=1 Tax=Crocosphaera sp. TaxID=2729996 RepID=UPI003F236412|nr:PepSY domain-containing protein [Crocosphaera sp.]